MTLGKEPTLIIQTIVAIATAIQVSTINMSTALHTIIACVVIGLGALINRQAVKPAAKTRAHHPPSA